jgi:hypothetical protein
MLEIQLDGFTMLFDNTCICAYLVRYYCRVSPANQLISISSKIGVFECPLHEFELITKQKIYSTKK